MRIFDKGGDILWNVSLFNPEPWTMNPEPLCYWFPKPFWSPQSGHCQVMALQDIPQTFSSMHSWHIWNPHRQRQQKRNSLPQQWHRKLVCIRRLRLVRGFSAVSFIVVVSRYCWYKVRWLAIWVINIIAQNIIQNLELSTFDFLKEWILFLNTAFRQDLQDYLDFFSVSRRNWKYSIASGDNKHIFSLHNHSP